MNVRELIERLQQEDPESEVHVVYNYGDYWRTLVAPSISYLEEGLIKWSNYHNMPKVMDDEDDEEDHDQVVLLYTKG